jgi:hypothetical protein
MATQQEIDQLVRSLQEKGKAFNEELEQLRAREHNPELSQAIADMQRRQLELIEEFTRDLTSEPPPDNQQS